MMWIMNSTKMLQTIIDIQKTMRGDIDGLRKESKEGFKEVNKRLDVIGKSVAFLEDDTPTREDHDRLKKRVGKIEKKLFVQVSA